MTSPSQLPGNELEQKIEKIVSDNLSQLKTANGAGIMHMGTVDFLLREDIKDLIESDRKEQRRALLDRVKNEVITAQDKKEYWPVWRKELLERQRTALQQILDK